MEIKRSDIRELSTFKKYGEIFEKIYGNDELNAYVFTRTTPYGKKNYEVVRGVIHKDKGKVTIGYPGETQFGIYGWYIMGGLDAEGRIGKRLATEFGEEIARDYRQRK